MALLFTYRRVTITTLMNIPKRGFKGVDDTYKVEDYSNVVFPPPGMPRKLPLVPKMPMYLEGEIPRKTGRRDIEMRGPELVHTELTHKQYGVISTDGGEMKWAHFEAVRNIVNRHIDKAGGEEKVFAVWRLAYPWLPRTPRAMGKKRGGGKAKIAHFVTPVRHGRVIFELGGFISETYAYRIMDRCMRMLPFNARAASYKQLLEEKEEEERRLKENMNKFTWDYMVKWNMQNISFYVREYDLQWGPKHR